MFESFGTEGLSLFTTIVAALIGLVTALIATNVITVFKEDKEEETEDTHAH